VIALTVVLGLSGGCADDPKEAFIAAYCDIFQPCCAEAGLRADGQQCRFFLGALAPGGYNAQAGEACLAEFRAAAMQPGFCQTSMSMESEACSMVFPSTGTKQPGATCEDTNECARSPEGEVSCESTFVNGATIQKCQVQVRGQEGNTPCLGTVEGNFTSYALSTGDVLPRGYLCHVADGLYCQDGGACTRLKQVGEVCMGGFVSDCARTTYCDFSQRMCLARKVAGEACTGSDECEEGMFCPTNGRVCSAQSANGAACTESAQCVSQSCTNGTCQAGLDDFGLILICGSP
jgi:hypothetical protein